MPLRVMTPAKPGVFEAVDARVVGSTSMDSTSLAGSWLGGWAGVIGAGGWELGVDLGAVGVLGVRGFGFHRLTLATAPKA